METRAEWGAGDSRVRELRGRAGKSFKCHSKETGAPVGRSTKKTVATKVSCQEDTPEDGLDGRGQWLKVSGSVVGN